MTLNNYFDETMSFIFQSVKNDKTLLSKDEEQEEELNMVTPEETSIERVDQIPF